MTLADALAPFPRERTWLLPALHAAQHAERWLSPATLDAVAAHLRVPKSEVWGVASHYPEFRLIAPGRRVVRVCVGLACLARGGGEILAACERRLGIRAGESTPDHAITLEALDCAFACGSAPVAQVDHHYRGRLTTSDVEALLTLASAPRARPATGRGGPPAALPAAGSPGARFTALKREAERRRTGARLAVGLGTCGLAVGAADTFDALSAETERRGLPFRVVAAGCNGMCWAQPVVEVLRDGKPRLTTGPISVEGVPRLLNALAAGIAERQVAAGEQFMAPQRRVLLERCGMADPYDVADALRHGAYGAFARALEDGRPEQVIEEVRTSGLAGRGGAYFQTAVKWAACRAAAGAPKFLVVNAEEGEPGIFKDRHLMEGDPHRLLEAVLLAAYASGASRAILYVHGEAELSAERLRVAVGQAREWGLLGERILGSDLSLDVELGRGSSTGRPLRAAVLGGPSGSVVPARQFDEPLVPRGPVSPGTGGVVALDEGASVADAVRTLLAFNMRESCGKCTPCREGTARLLRVLDGPVERERVSSLAEVIQVASLCGLGQAAPLAVLSALAEFPGEFGLS